MLILNFSNAPNFILRKQVVGWQKILLESMCRNYVYWKHLSPIIEKEIELIKKSVLVQIHNTAYTSFILQWCMIFGSDKERTHWKNTLKTGSKASQKETIDISEEYKKKVRASVHSYCNIDSCICYKCWTEMKESRDKYIAHLDIGKVPPMPFGDIAFRIAEAYSELLSKVVNADGVRDFIYPISEQKNDFQDEIETLFKK